MFFVKYESSTAIRSSILVPGTSSRFYCVSYFGFISQPGLALYG